MDQRLKVFARELRMNMTDAERKLWSQLRSRQVHGVRFRRQVPLDWYIVDFVCLRLKLVIEVDGSQHFVPDSGDAQRDVWLHQQDFRILRFSNTDVLRNTDDVRQVIADQVLRSLGSAGWEV